MKIYLIYIFTFLVFLNSSVSNAESFSGRAVTVSDGDTIQVMREGRAEKVRLSGIDCPERSQPFGKKAKEFTISMVAGNLVTVEVETKDRYGRTVGEVFLSDGRSLNRELVRSGLAWWYRKYSNDETLGALEAEARSRKIGLWSHNDSIPPWEYRRGKRAGSEAKPTNYAVDATYRGNVSSKVFHGIGCKYFECKNCTELFSDRQEALEHGFKPCGICKP